MLEKKSSTEIHFKGSRTLKSAGLAAVISNNHSIANNTLITM